MVEKLIRCTQCNKVIPQYDRFGDFGESPALPGVEWASDDLDAQKEFMELHGGHVLEELLVDRETAVSDRPAFLPCGVTYLEATNGKERFLIKRVKEGYDRPAFYELIPGQIRLADISLETQEEELCQEIEWLNGDFPPAGGKSEEIRRGVPGRGTGDLPRRNGGKKWKPPGPGNPPWSSTAVSASPTGKTFCTAVRMILRTRNLS
jgi:hypothetical protein